MTDHSYHNRNSGWTKGKIWLVMSVDHCFDSCNYNTMSYIPKKVNLVSYESNIHEVFIFSFQELYFVQNVLNKIQIFSKYCSNTDCCSNANQLCFANNYLLYTSPYVAFDIMIDFDMKL